jgi:hypothetical protein
MRWRLDSTGVDGWLVLLKVRRSNCLDFRRGDGEDKVIWNTRNAGHTEEALIIR